MLRKTLLVALWFPMSTSLLILLLVNLAGIRQEKVMAEQAMLQPVSQQSFPDITNLRVASAGNDTGQVLSAEVIAGDARAVLLTQFMTNLHPTSPIIPYADFIVKKADEYGIDYTLVPTIAECESNLGIRIPPGSYNAWGIAVYTGQQSGATFNGWERAIDWVSRYIKEKYYDQGLTDLRSISEKWAPPSVETGYSWSNCVSLFQEQIQ